VTENGDAVHGRASAESRLLLSNSNHVTVCSLLTWEIDGERLVGEDQDVWPMAQWRLAAAEGIRRRSQARAG
jgi:hypothetical protein